MDVIVVLHGFLGRPDDFYFLKNKFKNTHILFVDLFKDKVIGPHVPIKDWGLIFNEYMQELTIQYQNKFLVGYSLGGRLAFHAITEENSIWKKCLLIASGTGILDSEKEQRWKDDLDWAKKFKEEKWEEALATWNEQGIFKLGSNEPERLESHYEKEKLVQALTNWSLAKQDNFLLKLDQLKCSVDYIYGSLDIKYKNIAFKINSPLVKIYEAPDSAHRIFLDNPEFILQVLNTRESAC